MARSIMSMRSAAPISSSSLSLVVGPTSESESEKSRSSGSPGIEIRCSASFLSDGLSRPALALGEPVGEESREERRDAGDCRPSRLLCGDITPGCRRYDGLPESRLKDDLDLAGESKPERPDSVPAAAVADLIDAAEGEPCREPRENDGDDLPERVPRDLPEDLLPGLASSWSSSLKPTSYCACLAAALAAALAATLAFLSSTFSLSLSACFIEVYDCIAMAL